MQSFMVIFWVVYVKRVTNLNEIPVKLAYVCTFKNRDTMRSACLRRYEQPHVTAANARVMLHGAMQRSYLPTSSGICVRGGGVCRGVEQAGSKATVCLEQSR